MITKSWLVSVGITIIYRCNNFHVVTLSTYLQHKELLFFTEHNKFYVFCNFYKVKIY